MSKILEPPYPTLPPERVDSSRFGTVGTVLLVLGIICIAAAALLGIANPRQFAFSWLFATMVCFTLCAGSMFWTLLHHAVDANWTVVVRRLLEHIINLFPILAIAMAVLIFTPLAPELWKWLAMKPEDDVLLKHKELFLNQPFFYLRYFLYFTFFITAGYLLRKWSADQDQTANPYNTLHSRYFAYAGIPLLALSLTFGAFDWLMGLDFHWFSTMWGVYIFAGSVLSSMALLILISNTLRAKGFLSVMSFEHNHIMGKLLFAFTVFWAYISFSQYFLYYYANIPEETSFYILRNKGTWAYVGIFLVCGHFILPFLMLLTQPAKRTASRLCFAAGWILLMHVVDIYWIIMPAMHLKALKGIGLEPMVNVHILDFLSLAGLLCILAYFFIRSLSKYPLFPHKDPRLFESIHLKN